MPSSVENLLVDIGNSQIKWAISAGDSWRVGSPIENRGDKSDLSLWQDLSRPAGVFISNSAGQSCYPAVADWCMSHWEVVPMVLQSRAEQSGVRNGYADASSLGVDRWLALIAAHHAFKGALAVVDCGTAITVDALLEEGDFLGGVISAGPQISMTALTSKATHLSSGEMHYSSVFNTNTREALTSGALVFAAGGIERVLDEFEARLGPDFKVLVTGGFAHTIAALIRRPTEVYPDLVLEGIRIAISQRS